MQTEQPVTTIRMGAAHYDLTVVSPNGTATELDLSKAKRHEKREVGRLLCDAYGITGDPKQDNRKHSHQRKRKGQPHGKHKQGHQPAGQLSGKDPVRPDAAGDGAKKRSRRRSAPRTVPASGPSPN